MELEILTRAQAKSQILLNKCIHVRSNSRKDNLNHPLPPAFAKTVGAQNITEEAKVTLYEKYERGQIQPVVFRPLTFEPTSRKFNLKVSTKTGRL